MISRFVVRHNKLFSKWHQVAMMTSPLPGLLHGCLRWRLHLWNESGIDGPFVGILIYQALLFMVYIWWQTVWWAFFHGKESMIAELNARANCRIMEIPGMQRPIFVRPDDPGAKL